MSNFRWIICALLFFSTTVNYMDRQVISYLKEFFCTPAAAGGVIVQKLAGTLTDKFRENPQHAYLLMFIMCALSYLTAWFLMKAFVPRHKPITDL